MLGKLDSQPYGYYKFAKKNPAISRTGLNSGVFLAKKKFQKQQKNIIRMKVKLHIFYKINIRNTKLQFFMTPVNLFLS
jgi:hypothetical protein